jgi:hypothetical protein
MEITPKFQFVEGGFDTKDTKMVCVHKKQYMSVELCVKANKDKGWNIPIAKVKLHSRDTYGDASIVFDDQVKLCEEIARRWNECETKL